MFRVTNPFLASINGILLIHSCNVNPARTQHHRKLVLGDPKIPQSSISALQIHTPAMAFLSLLENSHKTEASLIHFPDFPGNAWSHEFIQSLNSPFSGASYLVTSENMVKDIKKQLNETFMHCGGEADLITRLSTVNSLLRLGIHRYFKQQIADALDYVHRFWIKNGGCLGSGSKAVKPDFSTTALAFKLLRLHRYHDITSEKFHKFRHGNGSFLDTETNVDGEDHVQRIKTTLNLLAAAYIQFAGEDILQEAEDYSIHLLTSWLSGQSQTSIEYPCYLVDEVKHALKYPWYMSSPRWEARTSINIYEANHAWMRDEGNRRLLDFAKLDFNIVQASHQQELKQLSRWWSDTQVSKLNIYRHRPVESYIGTAVGIFDPSLSDLRLALPKTVKLAYLLDDTYDSYASSTEIPKLTDAIAKFHNLLEDDQIQQPIRTAFSVFLQTASELNRQCVQKHGRRVENYLPNMWLQLVEAYEQELAWRDSAGYVPTVEEYLRNGAVSIAMWPVYFTGKFLICDSLPAKILQKPIPCMTKFDEICARSCRLHDDIQDFEESRQGLTAMDCWLKEHPGCSTEDALVHLKVLLGEHVKQMAQSYLAEEEVEDNDNESEMSPQKVVLEIARTFHFINANGDGFTHTNDKLKDQIRFLFFDPVW